MNNIKYALAFILAGSLTVAAAPPSVPQSVPSVAPKPCAKIYDINEIVSKLNDGFPSQLKNCSSKTNEVIAAKKKDKKDKRDPKVFMKQCATDGVKKELPEGFPGTNKVVGLVEKLVQSNTADGTNIDGFLNDVKKSLGPDECVMESVPKVLALAPVAPPMDVAQALSGSNLSSSCVEDFTSIFGKDNFDMVKFMQELPMDVAKVKLKLKSPFGKPKDSERTNVGLTVACIKALPESPSEILSLLKNIGMKMGLDLAADAALPAPPKELAEAVSNSAAGHLGFRAGINFSHLSAISYNATKYSPPRKVSGTYDDALGFQVGIVVDMAPTDLFHIQPGIMYIQKGTENNGISAIAHYVEVPLLLSLKFSMLGIKVGPCFGPYFDMYLGSDKEGIFAEDFGLSLGLGFDINMFYIGAFYDYGLVNVSYDKHSNFYNRTLGLNIGVNL